METSTLREARLATLILWRPRVTLALLLSYFLLFGMIIGAQGVLWADILRAFALSKTVFGGAQLVAPLLSVALLLAGGQLDRWLGKKRMALIALTLLAAAQLTLAGAVGLVSLIAAFVLTGVGNAFLEMAMNSATLDWERATRRSIMNFMHAGFSAGAVVGAFGAGALLELGWSYGQVLLLIALCAGLCFAATLPVRYPPAAHDTAGASSKSNISVRSLLRRPALAVLAAVCLLGIMGESIANLWSVIYLRELGAAVFLGGSAFALFNIAMFAGRMLNTPLIHRHGARVSLLLSGAGITLSGALLLLPGGVPVAVVAFILLGLAVAGVVPTVLSAAAPYAPGNSGAVTGAIMAIAYSGFVIIPPFTGWLADLFSLQAALVSVSLSGLAILWLARRIG